jgi:hypothetical protein
VELDRFDVLLERRVRGDDEQSLVITGLRGVGKTVLLTTFEEIALERGWHYTLREIGASTDLRRVLARATRAMLEDLSPSTRLKSKALRVLARLNGFALKSPEGFELAFDMAAAPDDEGLSEDFTDILTTLGEVAVERETGVAFLFDEMQFLRPDQFGPFVAALHRCVQRSLPVVFVGTGLPQVPKLAGEAKSYAERVFNYSSIGRLPTEAARLAIAEPARRQGVRYDAKALERMVEICDGYPFFVQHYGKFVWVRAEGPDVITSGDVEDAATKALRNLDEGFFQVRIQRTSEQERRYLQSMADLGEDGPYRSGTVASELGRRTSEVSVLRDGLIKKGLIYAPPGKYGYVDFTVPHFAGFMRRQRP